MDETVNCTGRHRRRRQICFYKASLQTGPTSPSAKLPDSSGECIPAENNLATTLPLVAGLSDFLPRATNKMCRRAQSMAVL